MNNKTKSLGAIGLIIGGLLLAIVMFVLFLNQQKEIIRLNDESEELNQQLAAKSIEFEELYVDCLEKTKELEGISQEEVAAAAKKAENGRFHLGISFPTLTNAEGLDLVSQLKTQGYNIWYVNEKKSDLGKMYYYKNGEKKAAELQAFIYSLFSDRSRFKLEKKSGGTGGGIPASIRDNAIIIKI